MRWGRTRWGRRRWGGVIAIGGDVPGGAAGFPFPLQPGGWKIEIFDAEGIKEWETGSDVGDSYLNQLQFSLEDIGCGAFSATFLRPIPLPNLTNRRLDIKLFGMDVPCYSGHIDTEPQDGSTEDTYKISGYGYFDKLDLCYVESGDWAAQTVNYIVDEIARLTVEPKTDIVYNADKITGGDYVVNSFALVRVKAKKALTDLAEIQQNMVFGVDERRELFFKPKDTTVNPNAVFWVGKHVSSFVPTVDNSKIRNKLYVYNGKRQDDKSNFVGTVQDDASIAALNGEIREDEVTLPTTLDDNDALRWANYRLSQLATPIIKGKLQNISLPVGTILKPEGLARVHTKTGKYYDLPLQRVTYKISGNDKLDIAVELGEKDFGGNDRIVEMLRNMKINELLSAANMRQI